MSAEPQRTCPICGNEFSGAMEFCPVCMLRKALADGVESHKHIPNYCALGPVVLRFAGDAIAKLD